MEKIYPTDVVNTFEQLHWSLEKENLMQERCKTYFEFLKYKSCFTYQNEKEEEEWRNVTRLIKSVRLKYP